MMHPGSSGHGSSASKFGAAQDVDELVERALLVVARRTNLSVETIHAMIVGRTGAAAGIMRAATSRKRVLLHRRPAWGETTQLGRKGLQECE